MGTVFSSQRLDHNMSQILTVYGYIRREQESVYVCKDIIDNIVLFYRCEFPSQFDVTHCGPHIAFIDSKKIQQYDPDFDYNECFAPKFSTILFGGVVSSDMCNKFSIDIRYCCHRKYEHRHLRCFMVGFTATKKDNPRITNWNEGIGMGDNKKHSVGLLLNAGQIYLYDANNDQTALQPVQSLYRNTLEMTFDFNNDCFSVQDKWIGTLRTMGYVETSMNKTKSIIVAVSIWHQEDTIEVLNWRFD
eukprot:43619_1